ncbi:MAG: hypothetical protein GX678_01135 [Actinomycetales bacterium]|nr:hypothetical protein [Actinomycetales bacterium]
MTDSDVQLTDVSEWLIQLVRYRADGSRINVPDVAEYFDRIRVAAAVIDGVDVAQPGTILVTILLDAQHDALRVDGVTREPLSAQACTRSVLHYFNTVAVFEDAIVDQHGTDYAVKDLPAEIAALIETAANPGETPVVHAMSGRDTISPGFIAAAAETPVDRAFVGDFTIVSDPSGNSADAAVDLATRSELPVATVMQLGDGHVMRAKIRVGRRTSTFAMRNAAPRQTLVATFGNTQVEELLADGTRLIHEAGAAVPEELATALQAIDPDSSEFLSEALALIGLPTAAADWLAGTVPDAEVTVVEPKSTGAVLKDSIFSEFQDEAFDSSKFLGKFRGFLRRRPVFSLFYGLAEVVMGLVVIVYGGQVLHLWTWLRWTIGLVWMLDGMATAGWAVLLLRARIRAAQTGSHASED